MISANEEYLISELKELGVDERVIEKLILRLRGWRIYIRDKKSEKEKIKEEFLKLKKQNFTTAQAVDILSKVFEKAQRTIYYIIKDVDGK